MLMYIRGVVVGGCSFVCQVASARRQSSDLFGLRVKLSVFTSIVTTQRSLSALPKDPSKLAGLISALTLLMLNASRVAVDILLKYFGPTRRGNWN